MSDPQFKIPISAPSRAQIKWLASLLAAISVILGLVVAYPDAGTAPAPPQTITVDLAAVAQAPAAPVDASQGLAQAPQVPNGGVPAAPADTPDQEIIIQGGFGAAPAPFAKITTANGGKASRFSSEQAVAVGLAESQHPTRDFSGQCEGFAGAFVFGWSSSGWYSADAAIRSYPAAYKHKVTDYSKIPPGAVVYWYGGFGHATLSAGGGKVLTTDFVRPGKVDLVPASQIAAKWFGGVSPTWVDPDWFPISSGNNGVKAPVIAAPPVITPAAPAIWHPIRPAQTKSKVARLKRHFHWGNQSRYYGHPFVLRIEQWQRNHHFLANGIIGKKQWLALTA